MVDTVQERRWLEQSQGGDPAAFENLIRTYQRMVFSLTYRMTGSASDAEDLAQDTFIRAYQQLGSALPIRERGFGQDHGPNCSVGF